MLDKVGDYVRYFFFLHKGMLWFCKGATPRIHEIRESEAAKARMPGFHSQIRLEFLQNSFHYQKSSDSSPTQSLKEENNVKHFADLKCYLEKVPTFNL